VNAWVAPWLVGLPLAGALVNGLAGGRLGKRGTSLVACLSVLGAFLLAVHAARGLLAADAPAVRWVGVEWVAVGDLQVLWTLQLDRLSVLLALVVTGVGFLIHVYSVGYMADDPDYARYFTSLNLFTASMLLLVLAGNLLVLFVGWELVGLCSYLLIGFWFERPAAAAAGRKAFVVNRVGDAAFLLGLCLLFTLLGTLDFREMASLLGDGGSLRGHPALAVAALLLFCGATGKSAQLPLYTWLPDAMEGPTPVSALIHAATMVTAGVFLVGRLWPVFEAAGPVLGWVVAPVGALTALFAATVALVQYDLKRVLAYSTISQLGYMFLALGVGAPPAAFFHLTTHAFFKALLFLAAGSVMHALHGQIDLRRLGGVGRAMPITFLGFLVGALSLSGIPPLAGFWSKEEVLGAAHAASAVLWAAAVATAFVTAYYASRATVLAFLGPPQDLSARPHEAPPVMAWPMALLGVLAAVGGFLGAKWTGAPFHKYLDPVFGHAEHATDPLAAAVGVGVAVAGVAVGAWVHRGGREPDLGLLRGFLEAQWGLEALYDRLVVRPGRTLARLLAEGVDARGIDAAASALAAAVARAGGAVRSWQTGNVRQYAAGVLAGAVVVFAYWVLR
jgi:NADH-quinone oxidoreductase subunit L